MHQVSKYEDFSRDMFYVYLEPCHPVLLVYDFPQPANEKEINT
jgi:hypothetical protein